MNPFEYFLIICCCALLWLTSRPFPSCVAETMCPSGESPIYSVLPDDKLLHVGCMKEQIK